jgi:NAD(P)H-nitrite reductase large subunit
MDSIRHVVIIGNGITGITAARNIRKRSGHRITVISAESDHFYSRTALMYIYMGQMTYQNTKPYEDRFWEKNRIDLVRGFVERIDTGGKKLLLSDGRDIDYDTLVIATGSKSNRFGWPGEDLKGVQGLYSLQDLESMEEYTRGIERGVVVGGGLIGIEVAEMLRSRHIPVTFLVREDYYHELILPREEGELVGRHILAHEIDLRLATELREILPDGNGRVRAVATSTGEEISCGFVMLAIGASPNIEVVRGSNIETDRGVLVNGYLETNIPDVYAGGDCAEFRSPKLGQTRIEQLWYTGRMHGELLARNICGERAEYERGILFNSAKFLDIEYQTYGMAPNFPMEGIDSLYWEHPDGQRSIRIYYSTHERTVTGFNLLGVRYRHQVCASWIHEKRSVEYVLQHLGEANFDPEFFRRFEKDVVALYNSRNEGRGLTPKSSKRLLKRIFG